MNYKIIYLEPTSPFHFQTGGGDHESVDLYPRSDTLSAAVTYWWFRQYERVPGFPAKLPFHISSLFPAIRTKTGIKKLYPKPIGIDIDPDKHNHKVFKKISWIDQDLFDLWRDGGNIIDFIPQNSGDKHLKRAGTVWVKDPDQDLGSGQLYSLDTRTRVVLDRSNSASTPFHFVSIIYASDLLFWFFADIDKKQEIPFMAMLRLLGDEGLGADRTVGMGHFNVLNEINDIAFANQHIHKWFNVGIYNPSPEEIAGIQWEQSAYNLENRRGWVSGKSLRRRPVPCITENAVLWSAEPLNGSIPCLLDKNDPNIPEDSKPDYSVYRDCRGFFIPCTN